MINWVNFPNIVTTDTSCIPTSTFKLIYDIDIKSKKLKFVYHVLFENNFQLTTTIMTAVINTVAAEKKNINLSALLTFKLLIINLILRLDTTTIQNC